MTLAVMPLAVACGSQPDPNARPTSLASLPLAAADIQFSGALTGRVAQVRVERCAARQDGARTNFYASVYFQLGDQWYSLQLITQNPFPRGSTSGYVGPGTYSVDDDFRDVQVNSGGITIGNRAWGSPVQRIMTMAPTADGKRVTMGMVGAGGAVGEEVELWPKRPTDTAPPPEPTPTADQIVLARGWWNCP
jgi:hypothetical protein